MLITEDKDFGELVFRLRLPHRGIILLRMLGVPAEKKAVLAAETIRQHLSDLPDAFSVFDGIKIRVRRGFGFSSN